MPRIERTEYLDRLKGLKNTPDIKIIIGIRRSGKSELMKDYINYIQETEPKANLIYIDFYDLEYDNLKNYKDLHEYVKKNIKEGTSNYLFIDEVQLCDKFELAISSIHNSGLCDIYITGSNAFLLSSDLSTLFTGRYVEIKIFPFCFKEFCLYYNKQNDLENVLDDYVIKGGLSGSYVYTNEIDRIKYLKDVYNTIVNRDLMNKYKIQDTMQLDHLSEFMMDNISNITSPNNISEELCKNSIKTNHVTIGNYIKYLCNAFMFYDVKRYDIKGKKYLETADKYYLADLGLRFSILGTRNLDYGRCYENIVCLELLRRGYDVYVGKLYQKEIDFVALNGSEKIYIHVSDDISSEKTFHREVDSLLKINDAYPKILLARTRHPEYQYEGVRIINIVNWLLDN